MRVLFRPTSHVQHTLVLFVYTVFLLDLLNFLKPSTFKLNLSCRIDCPIVDTNLTLSNRQYKRMENIHRNFNLNFFKSKARYPKAFSGLSLQSEKFESFKLKHFSLAFKATSLRLVNLATQLQLKVLFQFTFGTRNAAIFNLFGSRLAILQNFKRPVKDCSHLPILK